VFSKVSRQQTALTKLFGVITKSIVVMFGLLKQTRRAASSRRYNRVGEQIGGLAGG
jgi:hypothetical protein